MLRPIPTSLTLNRKNKNILLCNLDLKKFYLRSTIQ